MIATAWTGIGLPVGLHANKQLACGAAGNAKGVKPAALDSSKAGNGATLLSPGKSCEDQAVNAEEERRNTAGNRSSA